MISDPKREPTPLLPLQVVPFSAKVLYQSICDQMSKVVRSFVGVRIPGPAYWKELSRERYDRDWSADSDVRHPSHNPSALVLRFLRRLENSGESCGYSIPNARRRRPPQLFHLGLPNLMMWKGYNHFLRRKKGLHEARTTLSRSKEKKNVLPIARFLL